MEKVKSPVTRFFIHFVLILFAIYSIIPFFWTTLQSFKNLKDANSRTPLFFFTPTWENYQEIWLDSARYMNTAHLIYEKYGFTEREPYEESDIPDNFKKYWKFMMKKL